jgi:hypothetical protein
MPSVRKAIINAKGGYLKKGGYMKNIKDKYILV